MIYTKRLFGYESRVVGTLVLQKTTADSLLMYSVLGFVVRVAVCFHSGYFSSPYHSEHTQKTRVKKSGFVRT